MATATSSTSSTSSTTTHSKNTAFIRRHDHLIFHQKPGHRNLGTRGNRDQLQWGDDDATYADYNGEKDEDGNPVVTINTGTDTTQQQQQQQQLTPSPTSETETQLDENGNLVFNGSSCKAGNKRPCSPSAQPSSVPSPAPSEPTTSGPSPAPSPKPSGPPTPIPSLVLTFPPTTKAPTQLPTEPPTWVLTRSPTKGPSLPPTPPPTGIPSIEPTRLPTTRPTPGPTRVPTPPPTPGPTKEPTPNPTPVPTPPPTPGPTREPSPFPTPPPTKFPTRAPTAQPSIPPTSLPSLAPSMLPTMAIQTQTGINDTRITECSSPPLGDGISNIQLLAFQYNLYLPTLPLVVQASASEPSGVDRIQNATAIMEQRIHNGLVEAFLRCNGDADNENDAVLAAAESSFRVTAVMSAPIDQVNQTSVCDTTKDPDTDVPTECFVVVAQLTMDAFFPTPSTRRNLLRRQLQLTLADPEVLDSVGEYLNASMANNEFILGDDDSNTVPIEDRVAQVSFQGFLNVLDDYDGGTTTGSEVDNAEGVIGTRSGGSGNDSNVFLLGTAAFGGVSFLLFMVAFLVTRKNRSRQEAYLRQLDDLAADSEVSSQASHILADGKVHLVREEDYDRFEAEESEIEVELPASHSNVHFCASATCPICKHRARGPTFVSTNLSQQELEDLSPRKRSVFPNGRHYEAPDTVNL
ncbi:MAG: hypothetical protein SGBAC_004471 [Bacillariaceae sp.]